MKAFFKINDCIIILALKAFKLNIDNSNIKKVFNIKIPRNQL